MITPTVAEKIAPSPLEMFTNRSFSEGLGWGEVKNCWRKHQQGPKFSQTPSEVSPPSLLRVAVFTSRKKCNVVVGADTNHWR